MAKSKSSTSFAACPCVGATLDKLIQPALLAVLAKGPLHGYELTKRISEIPGFLDEQPDISGIYRLLKSLESRGMVISDWETAKGERAKRVFTLTDDGRRCLENWYETLSRHRKAIDALLKSVQKSIK